MFCYNIYKMLKLYCIDFGVDISIEDHDEKYDNDKKSKKEKKIILINEEESFIIV